MKRKLLIFFGAALSVLFPGCGKSSIDKNYHAGYDCSNSPSGLYAWWDMDSLSGTSAYDLNGIIPGSEPLRS